MTLLSFLCASPLSAAQTLFFIALLLPSHPEHDGPVPPPEGSSKHSSGVPPTENPSEASRGSEDKDLTLQPQAQLI